MPEDAIAQIRDRLSALEPVVIEVIDDSAAHQGHPGAAGGGGHYRLRMVSSRFTGQPKLTRHRLVYDLLADLMQREIHALTMNLIAPGEVESAPSIGSSELHHSSGHS
jgi:BolA protein